MEMWKEINGYDYKYLISSLGRVGRPLGHHEDDSGEVRIIFQQNKQRRPRRLKPLMALCFTAEERLLDEFWKPVPGFETSHLISNKKRAMRLLSLYNNNNGSKKVTLIKSGRGKCPGVHRLVLATFIRDPVVGEICTHRNGIKFDNRLENLEWIMKKEKTWKHVN